MRCEYCNHCTTAPNPISTGQGGGEVVYFEDINRHLCGECARESLEQALIGQEKDEDWK